MSVERFIYEGLSEKEAYKQMSQDPVLMGKRHMAMRIRYLLAKFEIGEPPIIDLAHPRLVRSLAHRRMIEITEGVPGHRSEVALVSDHQELWGIAQEEALAFAMRDLLAEGREGHGNIWRNVPKK